MNASVSPNGRAGNESAAERRWAMNSCRSVESLSLRHGATLILSRFEAGARREFHHVESEDVFGIGFHLRGGACFDMDGVQFATKPLEAWAGTAPRGSESRFTFPDAGFRTASLRFTPEAAGTLLQSCGVVCEELTAMVGIANEDVTIARLAPLDTTTAGMVESMFTTRYTGGVRTLFLESCALSLLAALFDATSNRAYQAASCRRPSDVRRVHEARDILERKLFDPPSIAALARLAGLNEFKLKRLFKEVFGTTVFGYVRQRRMERAAVDLRAGLTVSEAAAAAGYECPRCFADAFRRHYGMLPSRMNREILPAAAP